MFCVLYKPPISVFDFARLLDERMYRQSPSSPRIPTFGWAVRSHTNFHLLPCSCTNAGAARGSGSWQGGPAPGKPHPQERGPQKDTYIIIWRPHWEGEGYPKRRFYTVYISTKCGQRGKGSKILKNLWTSYEFHPSNSIEAMSGEASFSWSRQPVRWGIKGGMARPNITRQSRDQDRGRLIPKKINHEESSCGEFQIH